MLIDKSLDNIFNTNAKVKIIRLFISKRDDYLANGREISRLISISPPAAHTALKDLRSQDILQQHIIGKQHLYSINMKNRVVQNILLPAFHQESSTKDAIVDYIKNQIIKYKLSSKIISVLLYGSLQKNVSENINDVDIAVIAATKNYAENLKDIFLDDISSSFYEYFGLHLDAYVKSKSEFINMVKINKPPVSTLLNSYSVIYGKDIKEL